MNDPVGCIKYVCSRKTAQTGFSYRVIHLFQLIKLLLKRINDFFGHVMGDELIARLGGDEFVIMLPKTEAEDAEQIIKRINDLSLKEKAGTIGISISFGSPILG